MKHNMHIIAYTGYKAPTYLLIHQKRNASKEAHCKMPKWPRQVP